MEKRLLVVNPKDQIIRTETVENCHSGKGFLHRAFSILIFNKKNQILLSQRSKFKKLWPLFWDNTCSSHPLRDESYEMAATRRLREELGFTTKLKLIDKFQYQAQYKNVGSENEVCALLVGKYNSQKIKPNPEEIANWKWADVKKLQRDIKERSAKYTPWLKIGLEKYLKFKQNQERENLDLILSKFTKPVDPIIKKVLISNIDKKFQKIVQYQISTGGKRLRPALAIISCLMLGGKLKDALYAAAGLEILHNYTLIVDDIIDNSRLRRGKPTTWFKFGRSIAQCAAVSYSAAVFQAAYLSKRPIEVTRIFSKSLKEIMSGGEILDILFEQSGREDEPYIVKNRYKNITKEDYFEMAGKKTASLFEASCETGGILAGAKEKQLAALRNYGFNLGVAFQITDDILDIFGKEKNFGKVIGGDIAERKLGNIVILYALKELKLGDRKRFLKILRKKKINKTNIREAVKLIEKTNSREKAEVLGMKFAEKAKKSLNSLPQSKWRKILFITADSVISRNR